MNIAVVSLSPLSQSGGSERFTLDTIQSIRACGDNCDAFAIRDHLRNEPACAERRPFVHTFDGRNDRELPFRDVLTLLHAFDAVWVHQYLASDLVFDILDAARPHKPILLTNLGDESALADFRARYRPAPNHRFVHPAQVFDRTGFAGSIVTAAIWADALGSSRPFERLPSQLCVLDGLCAESGLETAVRALPSSCTLVVTGGLNTDEALLGRLRLLINDSRVLFAGDISEAKRRKVLASSAMLIVAQTPVPGERRLRVADPFSARTLFEALACGTLPVASDSEPLLEIMSSLGLRDFVFPARDHAALRLLIQRVLDMPPPEIAERKAAAIAGIRRCYLWDDFWLRVWRESSIESPGEIPRSALPGLKLPPASHAVSCSIVR